MSNNSGGRVAIVGGMGILAMLARGCDDDVFRFAARTGPPAHLVTHADDAARVSLSEDEVLELVASAADPVAGAALEWAAEDVPADTRDEEARAARALRARWEDAHAARLHLTSIEEDNIAGGRLEGESFRMRRLWVTHELPKRVVRNPTLLVLAPPSAQENATIDGNAPDGGVRADLRDLAGQRGERRRSQHLRTARELAAQIQAERSSSLVILAHSEERGATLVSSTGQKIRAVDVHSACLAARTRCIIVTYHGPDRAPGHRDALEMWEAARRTSEKRPLTVEQFALELRAELAAKGARRRITVSGTSAVGSGDIYAYFADQEGAE